MKKKLIDLIWWFQCSVHLFTQSWSWYKDKNQIPWSCFGAHISWTRFWDEAGNLDDPKGYRWWHWPAAYSRPGEEDLFPYPDQWWSCRNDPCPSSPHWRSDPPTPSDA